jgi:hypothetical protein
MITVHEQIEQGTEEWLELRKGVLTASEMKLILTPTLKVANNDNQRLHLFEIAAQRMTDYIEPQYINDDMLRGQHDEVIARDLYSKHYELVKEVGFISNDDLGFTLGYSPDGLVGDDGLIEIKSRYQKHQLSTIFNNEVPKDHYMQLQAGLFISARKWIDYISFCGGMPLYVIRVLPDPVFFDAIKEASINFEEGVNNIMKTAKENLATQKLIQTERLVELASDEINL